MRVRAATVVWGGIDGGWLGLHVRTGTRERYGLAADSVRGDADVGHPTSAHLTRPPPGSRPYRHCQTGHAWNPPASSPAGAFFANWASVILIVLTSQSMGLLIGATVINPQNGQTIATIFMLSTMLVRGQEARGKRGGVGGRAWVADFGGAGKRAGAVVAGPQSAPLMFDSTNGKAGSQLYVSLLCH